MPIGLDAERFTPQPNVERVPGSMLYVGRLSRSKRIGLLLSAFKDAYEQRPELSLSIVGGTTSPEDAKYEKELKEYVAEHSLPVTFVGPVTWTTLPQVYSAHELCINLSPPGMFDKVIGEALFCECDILTTNHDLQMVLGDRCMDEISVERVAAYIRSFSYDAETVQTLKQRVAEEHSLKTLAKKVLYTMKTKTHQSTE